MELLLNRVSFTNKATEGTLSIDGDFECFTLEDTDRDMEDGGVKVYGETAIPRGTYKVVLTMSNRFKKVLPEVLEVPGFKGIRIHSGNSSKDSEGCILLGSVNASGTDDWISSSKVALENLMSKLKDADEITLRVV